MLNLSFANWSIRYKLLSLLLLLAVITLAVTGTIAYFKNVAALRESVFNQLTGVTRSKRSQIELYYRTIHSHVETLSDDRMFIDAMREFRDAYRKLNKAPVQATTLDAVREDYRDHFYPEMQKLRIARHEFQAYLPVTPAAIQLQYLYIARNPRPDRREELINPGDGSEYSRVHQKYHVALRSMSRNSDTTIYISSTPKQNAKYMTSLKTETSPLVFGRGPIVTAISRKW